MLFITSIYTKENAKLCNGGVILCLSLICVAVISYTSITRFPLIVFAGPVIVPNSRYLELGTKVELNNYCRCKGRQSCPNHQKV